jgi:hypothetical protein
MMLSQRSSVPPQTLRRFAAIWLLLFAGQTAAQAIWGRFEFALLAGIVALLVGLPGMIQPALIRPVHSTLTLLTFALGWLISTLVLALLYFGVFTPVAMLFRVMGRDVLCRRPQAGKETYWTARPAAASLDRYFRPF